MAGCPQVGQPGGQGYPLDCSRGHSTKRIGKLKNREKVRYLRQDWEDQSHTPGYR